MSSNAGTSAPPAKRSILEDFKGDKDQAGLVPLDRVDALLTAKGSLLETERRYINGRLTTVWKQLPDSVRDGWVFAATVRIFASSLIPPSKPY